MSNIADSVALLKLMRIPKKVGNPWYNSDLNEERRSLRLTERTWKQDPSAKHLQILRNLRRSYKKHIRDSKLSFFREQLDNASSRPSKLFELIKNQSNEQI